MNTDERFITVSGHVLPENLEASRRAGFVEHLAKPVTMDKLRGAIARATGQDRHAPPPPSFGSDDGRRAV